jgi:hypothetical protein
MTTDLEGRLRELLHEDAQRARLVNSDRPPGPDVVWLSETPMRARSGRRLVALAAAIAVVASAGVVVVRTAVHRRAVPATLSTVTTVPGLSESVAEQTTRLAHILYTDLPLGYGLTSIDSSTPGVITITGLFNGYGPRLAHESQLVSAGTESGLWTAADAARMVQTRARDGMVRSDNGKTTWSYHADGGLEIVARVP